MKYLPVFFAPDFDTSWSANPGCLSQCDGLLPLQNGNYGTVGAAVYAQAWTGNDYKTAYLFRQTDGTVRLLAFTKATIYDVDGSNVQTTVGSLFSSSTADWSATAWGNQIIACNYLNATQSSTATAGAFTALSTAPKARYVASNLDHVMFADVDDGGSNVFSDMVWWSGLQDPTTWAPAIGGEQGRIRLLQAPGPIKALVSFQDRFVAFKDNAIIVGEYIGPPFVFGWRLLSNRIGCVAPKSVVELDGKLYWLHSSGFYEFDGQTIRNIGQQVNQTFLGEIQYALGMSAELPAVAGGYTPDSISLVQAAADEVEGVILWKTGYTVSSAYSAIVYGYNARSQKWGRYTDTTNTGTGSTPVWVRATTQDITAFAPGVAQSGSARALMIYNGAGASSANSKVYSIGYPRTNDLLKSTYLSTFSTGVIGDLESTTVARLHIKTAPGSSAMGGSSTATGYRSENKVKSQDTATGTINTEFNYFDFNHNARWRKFDVSFGTGLVGGIEKQIVAGIALDPPGGKR